MKYLLLILTAVLIGCQPETNTKENALADDQLNRTEKEKVLSEDQLTANTKGEILVTSESSKLQGILDLEFYLPEEAEGWYNGNYKENVKSNNWTVCNLYSRPDIDSDQVGQITTYYDPSEKNFILQFINKEGHTVGEFRDIGDWGYGIHMNVVNHHSEFVQFPESYLGYEAWVKLGEKMGSLHGYVSSYIGQIVALPSVSVRSLQSGDTLLLKEGHYVIEKWREEAYILRLEVPTDMPCGDDPTEINLDSLPRYELPTNNLFTAKGDIIIGIAYPRGC